MLTFSELQTVNAARCARWHPGFATPGDTWSLADWSNATQGEVGELAEAVLILLAAVTKSSGQLGNLVKKIRRIETGESAGIRIGEENLAALLADCFDEAADVVTYLDLLVTKLGGSLGEAIVDKFKRVSIRQVGGTHRRTHGRSIGDRVDEESNPREHARDESRSGMTYRIPRS